MMDSFEGDIERCSCLNHDFLVSFADLGVLKDGLLDWVSGGRFHS
jgi:hypothetical protein